MTFLSKVALVFVVLSSTSHGRRMRNFIRQLQASTKADFQFFADENQSTRLEQSQELGRRSSTTVVAFVPCSQATSRLLHNERSRFRQIRLKPCVGHSILRPTSADLWPRSQSCLLCSAELDKDSKREASSQSKAEEELRAWVEGFIIRHGLCPWAGRAAMTNSVKLVVTDSSDEDIFLKILERETSELLEMKAPGLSTTLVGCTGDWAWDFERFDGFVETAMKATDRASLVCFHPSFVRWRHVDVGDAVSSHYMERFISPEEAEAAMLKAEENGEEVDLTFMQRRSKVPAPGVVLDTSEGVDVDDPENSAGVRNVIVEFQDGEQEYLPLDWLVLKDAEPLGDNLMHRSPVPVVHILRFDTLSQEVDRAGTGTINLQLRNAHLLRRAAKIFKPKF